MSEVIETDFVLGKIDGQRYEPVAIELRNQLRCNGRLKDCLDTILETFDDTTSAMLFSAVASLIDKMFNGLEYELENLFWEPTVFADRSTGRFVSLVIMLGDCRIGEVARVIFEVELDIGSRYDLFNKRFADKLCETNKGLFIDRQIVEEISVQKNGWLTRWRAGSLNKLYKQFNDLKDITSSFVSRYSNDEPRELGEIAKYQVEALTIQTPLVVSVRQPAISKELTLDDLATTQAIVTVCLEIPQDYYSS